MSSEPEEPALPGPSGLEALSEPETTVILCQEFWVEILGLGGKRVEAGTKSPVPVSSDGTHGTRTSW